MSWDTEEKDTQKEDHHVGRLQRLKEAVSEFRYVISFFKQKSGATPCSPKGLTEAEKVRMEEKYFKQLNLFENE